MAWRIGVDIGGTFTDVALVDEASGRIGVVKVLTTPRRFQPRAWSTGCAAASSARRSTPAEVALLAHATTVVTNALFEKKGARAGLRHDARLSRPARTAPLVARRSVRSVPGPARRAGAAPLALRGHRADRCAGRGRDAARRGRDRRRWSPRSATPGWRRSRSRCCSRSSTTRTSGGSGERLRAALPGCRDLSVLRGAARDPRVRAHQHDRGLRLCRAAARRLSRPAADGGVRHSACRRFM